MDILSLCSHAVKSMGKIAVAALRRPTLSEIELLRSTDVTHRQGSQVSSFILERFACSWPKIWYIMQKFVISTRVLVMHCSAGAEQSIY